jgi:hypothetical protein
MELAVSFASMRLIRLLKEGFFFFVQQPTLLNSRWDAVFISLGDSALAEGTAVSQPYKQN